MAGPSIVLKSSVPRYTGKSAHWAAIGILFLCQAQGACGFHREGAALERLRVRIRGELGTDASVNVHSAYGATTVTIRLAQLPAGDSRQVQARVEELTKAEFPSTGYVVLLGRP